MPSQFAAVEVSMPVLNNPSLIHSGDMMAIIQLQIVLSQPFVTMINKVYVY